MTEVAEVTEMTEMTETKKEPKLVFVQGYVAARPPVDLESAVEELNSDFPESIAVPFGMVDRQRFAGGLRASRLIPHVVCHLQVRLGGKVRMHIGAGIGPHGNASPGAPSAGSTAEELARKAAQLAIERGRWVLCMSAKNEADRVVNTLFFMSQTLRSRWTIRQWEAYAAYLNMNQRHLDVAQALGVSRPAVTQMFGRMQLNVVEEGERTIAELGSFLYGI